MFSYTLSTMSQYFKRLPMFAVSCVFIRPKGPTAFAIQFGKCMYVTSNKAYAKQNNRESDDASAQTDYGQYRYSQPNVKHQNERNRHFPVHNTDVANTALYDLWRTM